MLQQIVALIGSEHPHATEASAFKSHMMKYYEEVDVKAKGEIDMDGIVALLRKMNMKISNSEVKSALKVPT
jgi:hypothetical protein